MSLRDLATGASCAAPRSAAGPSSALSAVADAVLPSTSSLPFPSTAAPLPSTAAPAPAELALLVGDLPPELRALATPAPAPPHPAPATDLFERAFPPRPHPASRVPRRAPAHFDAAFRDAAHLPYIHPAPPAPQSHHHPPRPSADLMFDHFARFALTPAAPKPPLSAAPYWPARPIPAPLHAPLPVHYPVAAPAPAAPASAHAHAQREPHPDEEPSHTAASDAQSWGDEFTSLEADEGLAHAFARPAHPDHVAGHVPDQLRYDDSFEDMYEAAFRDFLGAAAAHQDYRFAEADAQQRHARSAADALEDGLRLREAGKLTMAVRAFEEALNRDRDDPHPPLDTAHNAKAWYLLGLTLAESDDDAAAIVALQQGLGLYKGLQDGERRQDNPYLLNSLIALAVSYTNEQVQPQAFGHIKEWFDLWCKQNGVNSNELNAVNEPSMNGTELEDVFHEAGKAGAQGLLMRMRKAAENTAQDADIRIVMGVLHNLNREYSKAAETLRSAVMIRPNDPGLWNKLGATLANGGQSDDALRAYRRSVDINPALVRAWVNVGTAYANRGEFPKAARYYLKAVAMAEDEATTANERGITGTEDRMAHVWGYLRTTLISMSRADILHLVDSRDVKGLRSHFTF